MQSKEFLVTSSQFTFYTPQLLQFTANKILEGLLQKFASVFNGDTIAVPLPSNAPGDIPRIILQSSNAKFKVEISVKRVNFFLAQQNKEPADLDSFLALGLNILETYKELTQVTIGRLALVAVRYLENSEPAKSLAVHFCKPDWISAPFNRPENFEIHSHKKYSKEDFTVNSWVRCKTGNLKEGNVPIVMVVQDINTLAEELNEKNFSVEDAKKFVEFSKKEQAEILKLYFPDK